MKSMFEYFKFEFWIIQTTSDGETTKVKVVDLEKFWNFVVDNLFEIILSTKNYDWISQIWNSDFVNDLRWRNYQNESCRSRKVMKLCS